MDILPDDAVRLFKNMAAVRMKSDPGIGMGMMFGNGRKEISADEGLSDDMGKNRSRSLSNEAEAITEKNSTPAPAIHNTRSPASFEISRGTSGKMKHQHRDKPRTALAQEACLMLTL